MAEHANGALNRQPGGGAPAADRSLDERRADIAKARGRISADLEELERRARRPFQSIANVRRALPTDSGFVHLLAATSGLVARFRRLAPLFASHRGLTIGLAVAAGLVATAGWLGDSEDADADRPRLAPRLGS